MLGFPGDGNSLGRDGFYPVPEHVWDEIETVPPRHKSRMGLCFAEDDRARTSGSSVESLFPSGGVVVARVKLRLTQFDHERGRNILAQSHV